MGRRLFVTPDNGGYIKEREHDCPSQCGEIIGARCQRRSKAALGHFKGCGNALNDGKAGDDVGQVPKFLRRFRSIGQSFVHEVLALSNKLEMIISFPFKAQVGASPGKTLLYQDQDRER